MKSFRDRNPYAVGIVTVLLLLFLTGAAFAVGTYHLLERVYEMEGVFADAAGIKVSDDVKLAGVKVGRVTDIDVDRQNGHVVVTWVVNNGTELGKGTTAEIALVSLLGAKFLRLGGPVAEPFLQELPREERVVPIERTKVPFDVFELTRVATEGVQGLHTDALNSIVNDLADITADKRQQVTDLVTALDTVSSAINERSAQLTSLLDRADALAATLAEKDQTLVQLIDASKQILDLITLRRDELAVALGQGSEAVGQLTRIIVDHEVGIDRILDTLDPALDVIDRSMNIEECGYDIDQDAAQTPDASCLDVALAWLGPGFLQQVQAGTNGPWLEIFVRSLGPDILGTLCDILQPTATYEQCTGSVPAP
ncbi:MAG: MlaD family protein [Acidimicrobiales bacterium]